MNLRISLSFVLLILFLGSCTWIRSLTEPDEVKVVDEDVLSPETLQEKLGESNIDFDWITARTRINYRSPSINASGSGRLVMVRDSLIWGTANAVLGIEVGRFSITPDSVRIINRYDRTYTSLPFSFLQKQTGHSNLTFSELQQLLAGNYPYDNRNDLTSSFESPHHLLHNKTGQQELTILIHHEFFRPAGYQIVRNASQQSFDIEFADHKEKKGGMFPGSLRISAKMPENVEIFIRFENVNFEPADNLSFDVPDGYERIH
jgi:hypothetical protein